MHTWCLCIYIILRSTLEHICSTRAARDSLLLLRQAAGSRQQAALKVCCNSSIVPVMIHTPGLRLLLPLKTRSRTRRCCLFDQILVQNAQNVHKTLYKACSMIRSTTILIYMSSTSCHDCCWNFTHFVLLCTAADKYSSIHTAKLSVYMCVLSSQ